ncbi:MAG: chemotaxis protein CheX [Clostridia bacterium]|nr:chemotaxis protein CheX [Clostridia bacterium]
MRPDITPFLKALEQTFLQFGIHLESAEDPVDIEAYVIEQEVTAYIGIVGDFRGNISFSFPSSTAKRIASLMMMGMPVETFDDMSRSAIAEIANMISGNALSLIVTPELKLDITPPSLLIGDEVFLLLSYHTTKHMKLMTSMGEMMLNVVIE